MLIQNHKCTHSNLKDIEFIKKYNSTLGTLENQ